MQEIEPPVYEAVPSGQTGNSPKTVSYTDDIDSMGAPLYAMPQGEQTDPRYQIATVKPIPETTTNSYAREQKLLQELELLPQQQQQDVYDGAPLHIVQEGVTMPPPAPANQPCNVQQFICCLKPFVINYFHRWS